MPYSVKLTKTALKDFNSLSPELRTGVAELLADFENYPDTKKESEIIAGYEGRKIRSGNHRIIFTVNTSRQQVVIRLIRPQKELYARLADILS